MSFNTRKLMLFVTIFIFYCRHDYRLWKYVGQSFRYNSFSACFISGFIPGIEPGADPKRRSIPCRRSPLQELQALTPPDIDSLVGGDMAKHPVQYRKIKKDGSLP